MYNSAKNYKSHSKTIIGWKDCFWQLINSSFRGILFNLFYKIVEVKAKSNITVCPFFKYINLGLRTMEHKNNC